MTKISGNDPSPWNMLHDGSIDKIQRNDTDVRVTISCEYIRETFGDTGELFFFDLSDCTRVSFLPYEGPPVEDLEEIPEQGCSILSADWDESAIAILTGEGSLKLKYAELTIHIDSGRVVQLDELDKHAIEYWESFGKQV